MISRNTAEARKPPVNRGPSGGLVNRLLFALRKFLDLQVCSVVASITPWLKTRSGSLLEVGCGDQPYRFLVPSACVYTGLDWEGAKAEFAVEPIPDVVYYQGATFPMLDQSYDSVFHTEVLEHVIDFRTFLTECRRVLKPGGEMMFTVPFQARFHYIPYDYWRFTKSGLEFILTEAGFTDVKVMPRGTDLVVASYKVIGVLYRFAYGGILGKFIFVLFSSVVFLPLCLAHFCMKFGLGSSDDCLGYSVVASRPRFQTAYEHEPSGADGDALG